MCGRRRPTASRRRSRPALPPPTAQTQLTASGSAQRRSTLQASGAAMHRAVCSRAVVCNQRCMVGLNRGIWPALGPNGWCWDRACVRMPAPSVCCTYTQTAVSSVRLTSAPATLPACPCLCREGKFRREQEQRRREAEAREQQRQAAERERQRKAAAAAAAAEQERRRAVKAEQARRAAQLEQQRRAAEQERQRAAAAAEQERQRRAAPPREQKLQVIAVFCMLVASPAATHKVQYPKVLPAALHRSGWWLCRLLPSTWAAAVSPHACYRSCHCCLPVGFRKRRT